MNSIRRIILYVARMVVKHSFRIKTIVAIRAVHRIICGLFLLCSPAIADETLQPKLSQNYTIPSIDISGETVRQVVVAQGTDKIYQGHVHTLLMPDGKTMYAVWTYEHGGRCGPLKRSNDAGLTWSELLDVPENWKSTGNCPTIHRLTAPDGKTRLVVFANGKGGLLRSFSEDEGRSWSAMEPTGISNCGVPPITVEPIEKGKTLLTWYHIGAPDGRDASPLSVLQAASHDGGLTWGEVKVICIVEGNDKTAYARSKKHFDPAIDGADPCEPAVVRSPDGKQLLLLMRENRRRLNSLYITSDDEGKTWSSPKELTASLTGDRHMPRYAPDGRLVVVMRDTAAKSPTVGHFVAWVGQYDDIINGREGQYRVKLLHSHAGWDCGYPGLESLPDGTMAATTYIKYRPGPEKHSIISVRFKLSEIDAKNHNQAKIDGTAVPADESASPKKPRPSIGGILYNEDDSHRFGFGPPDATKPKQLDALVDELADSQATIMLICCCAKNTCYDSKVWDVLCAGFDPAKDNQQPYFGDLPKEERDGRRTWAHNLRALLDAGVDPMQRMIDRCRQRHISPWVSIRMNDVHDANLLKCPSHSRFWMEHPEYRLPDRGSYGGFNFGLKPVRDHIMALIREVCNRFDMDGLELDWNRFPLNFREGEEIEQGKVLTEWMAEVREVVRMAEKKWKHPICLAARVPARPEVSLGTGLDAVAWAKRGLIDHLIVAPFWRTTDFDIPVEQWIKLLEGTGIGVTAGLEIRVQPYPSGPTLPNTIERRRGAALAALARGSQGIYLFNYFDIGSQMPQLLKEMGSVESLTDKDRSYVVTYVDISIPGKPIPAALPKNLTPGQAAEFSLFIGPKPHSTAKGEVQLTLTPEKAGETYAVQVMLNGQPPVAGTGYAFSSDAFREGYNTIRVVNAGASAMTIGSVELSLRFPPDDKNSKNK